jgi:hypothetical protein
MAREDDRVAGLAQRGICMGNVYATTSDAPIWREKLPDLGQSVT